MKTAICLVSMCLLAGLVSSEYAWELHKVYTYDAHGRLMSGDNKISNQNAGLDITYRMTVYVKGPNTIVLKPSKYKVIETNEEVEGGWREGDFTEGTQSSISPQLLRYLEAPMEAKVLSGVIVSLTVPSGMPTWVENMKRAQASHFIIDSTGSNVVLEGNLNRNTDTNTDTNNVRTDTQAKFDDMSGYFYKTMEQTVYGECETYYTVSQTGGLQSFYQLQSQAQPEISPAVQPNKKSSSSEENLEYNSSNSREESDETYQQGELPWPKALTRFCNPNDQIYEVRKVLNFTRCNQKAVLGHVHPAELINCRPGDNQCGSNWARVVQTKFLLCGTSRRSYNILKITQDEFFSFGLSKEHTIHGGIVCNSTINNIQPATAEHKIEIRNPKVLDNLVHYFDPREQQLLNNGQVPIATHSRRNSQDSSSEENTDQYRRFDRSNSDNTRDSQSQETVDDSIRNDNVRSQLPLPSLKLAPLSHFMISPLTKDQMPKRIDELLEEVCQAIGTPTDKQSIAESETVSNLAAISRVIRRMNAGDISEVVQRYNSQSGGKQQRCKFNFMVDCVAVAGTNPAIVVLNELIEKEIITGAKAALILSNYPTNIRYPTPELLNHISQLIETKAVQKQEQVKINGILALTNLLYLACICKNSKESRYPVSTYGHFCNEDLVRSKYTHKYIDSARRNLKGGQNNQKWATVDFAALGNLGDPSMLPFIQEVLDTSKSAFQKVNAIYAMKRVITSRDNENKNQQDRRHTPIDRTGRDPISINVVETKVLPILMSVSFDKSEHHQVRIAGIEMLIYCNMADNAVMEQLALLTWDRQDSQEIRSFIYSTIKGLATINRPLSASQWRMKQKALAVLPLTNHFEQGYALSKNIFHSEKLEHIVAGEFFQASYIGSRDSNIPNNIYYRSYHQFGAGGIGVNPLEVSLRGNSLSRLADRLWKQVVGTRPDERNAHPQLHELKNLLGIESRDMNESPQASLYINVRNEMSSLFVMSADEIEAIIPKLKIDALLNLKRGINLDNQYFGELAGHTFEMTTSLGVPLIYNYRNPFMMSLRGEMKLVNNGFKDNQVLSQIHFVYSWKTHGSIAFKLPFLGKIFKAGIQRHFTFEAPLRVSVRRAESKEVVISVTPMQLNQDRPQGKIDILTYHQHPYTAILTDEFYPTVHRKGGKMEIVHSENQSPVSETQQSFGEQALGFAFNVDLKSDFRQEKESIPGWLRFVQKFKNPFTLYKLGYLGDNDVKFASRKLVLDLDRSPAKTLVLAVAAKRQDGSLPDWSVQSSGSSSSSSSESQEQPAHYRANRVSNRVSGSDEQVYSKHSSTPILDIASSSFESSKESSSKESNSAEQVNQISERRRTIVVALVTKKQFIVPSVEHTSNIVQVLGKGENHVQYLLQYVSQDNRVSLRLASGDAANQAAEKFRQVTSSSSVKSVIESIVKVPNDKKQQDGCIEFKGKYEGPRNANQNILVVLRKTLLENPLTAFAQGKLLFGKSCNDFQYNIKIDAKLRRGEKMTRWAATESREAKLCSQDEKDGFYSSPICQWVARNQASLLNIVNLKLKANRPLPPNVRNFTRMGEDAIRFIYYPSQSYNSVPEENQERTTKPESLEINYKFSPDSQFFNVEVVKPKSRWELNNVKANSFIEAFLPLSATVSIVDSVREAVMGVNAQRICSVEQNNIATFDNVTTTFRRSLSSGCYTLLAKQCASNLLPPMAVSVKNIGSNNMDLLVHLGGNTKIEVITSRNSRSQFTVKVNDQHRQLPYIHRNKQDQEAQSGDYIAKIVQMPNVGVQIITPTIKVAIDGKRVIVFSHPAYHNSTCGVCGNNDGEKVADMRSPKNIPLSRGSLFVASWQYDGKDGQDQQCKIDSKLQREVKQEETLVLNNKQWFPRSYLRSASLPQQQEWSQQQQLRWQQQQQQQQQRWQQQQQQIIWPSSN